MYRLLRGDPAFALKTTVDRLGWVSPQFPGVMESVVNTSPWCVCACCWLEGSVVELLLVGWLLNVPATCECISGTDLLRQFYVLPH